MGIIIPVSQGPRGDPNLGRKEYLVAVNPHFSPSAPNSHPQRRTLPLLMLPGLASWGSRINSYSSGAADGGSGWGMPEELKMN